MYVNIKEGDIGGEDVPGKSDGITTVEVLKEKEKRIMAIDPQQDTNHLFTIPCSFPTPLLSNTILATIEVISSYTNIPHTHGLSAC